MSIWTHVLGAVRIDALPIGPQTNWKEFFGKECAYDAPNAVWSDYRDHSEDYLPGGSEGTLKSILWTNPDPHHMAKYTLTIFGDLRDYDTPEEIIKWFKEKVAGVTFIRSAVITVELEGAKPLVWNYSDEE